MTDEKPFRLPAAKLFAIAAVIALACMIPSFAQAPHASAQTQINCGPQFGYTYGGVCPQFGTYGGVCNAQGVDANGNPVCTALAQTFCPDGSVVYLNSPCPTTGCTGYGQCYQNPYGPTTASSGIGVCGRTIVLNGICNASGTGPATAAGNGPGPGVPGSVNCGNGKYATSAQGCAALVAAASPPGYSPPQTAASTAGTTSASGPANGVPVTFGAGWNLVSAPDGTVITGAGGPLLTLQAGDSTYESLPNGSPAKGGRGYWAYFGSSFTLMLTPTAPGSVTVTLPAGSPILIGNPGTSTATVTGATSVKVFDPASNGYVATTTLKPGQGGWAQSDSGGTATITTSA
jgi:hypothetical protein